MTIPSNHYQDDICKPDICLILDFDQNPMGYESGQDISRRQILGHISVPAQDKTSRMDGQADIWSVSQSVGQSITSQTDLKARDIITKETSSPEYWKS